MMTPAPPSHRSHAYWLLDPDPKSELQARLGSLYRQWLILRRNPLAAMGLTVLALLVALAILAPLIAGYSPIEQDFTARLAPPSVHHFFGTDEFGRDIFSRVIYGTRITLVIVLVVVAIAGPLGLIVGCAAGYFGGLIDTVMMRITDIFLAFPRLVLALALVTALGPGIINAVLAIALTGWPPYARVARSEALVIRNTDYIKAARLSGCSHARIVLGHILPICLTSTIVRVALDMSGIILIAAGLGFLGLGAQPPSPEWGAMVASGRQFAFQQWWVSAMPGLAIFVVSLGFNLLGDGLRDALDPRRR